MSAVKLTLGFFLVGPPETGLWCDPCALPSVIAGDVLLERNGCPQEIRRFGRCTNCGGRR